MAVNTRKAVLILALHLFFMVSFAGNTKIDSLQTLLNTPIHDTIRCSALIDVGIEYLAVNKDSAVFYFNRALQFSDETRLISFKPAIYAWLSLYHYQTKDDTLAGQFRQMALEFSTKVGSKSSTADHFYKIALSLRKIGKHEYTLEYLQTAARIFEATNQRNDLSMTYSQMGLVHRTIGNFELAVENITKGLEIKKELGDKRGMALAYGNLGVIYRFFGQEHKAIENYMLSLKIFEELGDKENVSKTYNNVATIYFNSENYREAMQYYSLSLAISEEINDKPGMARASNNIGKIHELDGDFEKASVFYNRAEKLCLEINDKEILGFIYLNKGNIFSKQGKYELAKQEYEKSIQIRQQINDYRGLVNSYLTMARLFRTMADKRGTSQALESALSYGLKGVAIAETHNLVVQQSEAYQLLMELYDRMGNYSEALQFAKKYIEIQSNLVSEEKTKILTELQTKFNISQKEQEIEKQKLIIEKQEAEKQRRTIERNYMTLVLGLLFIISAIAIGSLVAIRRRNHALIETQAKLTEAIKTKDRLFSIIAHDLKSPFTSLVGLTQIMAIKSDTLEPQKVAKYSKSIYFLSRQLLDLIENLLNWSRSQTGRIKLDPRPISIDELLSDIVPLVSHQAEEKNIAIDRSVDSNAVAFVDYDSLSAVFRNLLSNAIKFTPDGGKISILAESTETHVLIKVCDTGIGIPPENLARLFKTNETFSTKGTNQESGTGLGLVVCKEFVERNGGAISVESKVGEGTCFTITLPAYAAPAAQ